MAETPNNREETIEGIDDTLNEYLLGAGVIPDYRPDARFEWRGSQEPTLPYAHLFSEISPELRFLSDLYFKRVVSFEEVMAPDRRATIDMVRREGRI